MLRVQKDSTVPPVGDTQNMVPRHFYSLDALRGLAALSVVLCHWPFFFFQGTARADYVPGREPIYFLLGPLYSDGWRAVDLFFCLSGFVFFWLYAERIRQRETSPGKFAALRFSRLYPLHFITLLAVALGQQWMLKEHGSFFVVKHNDLYHFGLNLLFASTWGLQSGHSFNAPVWSVSIEILLYGVFFIVCRLNPRRWWHLGALAFIGYLSIKLGAWAIGRGMLSFFVGCMAFQMFTRLRRSRPSRVWLQWLTACTIFLWAFVPINVGYKPLHHLYRGHLWSESLNFFGKDVGTILIFGVSDFSFETLLFPLTIITLALWEAERGPLGKRLAVLGQISYSSYLWHFPLQMAFMAATTALGLSNAFYRSPWSMLLFFSVLLPLSYGSYHLIELPCQAMLRARLLRVERRRAPRTPDAIVVSPAPA